MSYDRDLIVATMKSNGFDRVAAAEIVGCDPITITRQMQMAARAEGKPSVSQKIRGGNAKGVARIKWDAAAIMKVTAILARNPPPLISLGK